MWKSSYKQYTLSDIRIVVKFYKLIKDIGCYCLCFYLLIKGMNIIHLYIWRVITYTCLSHKVKLHTLPICTGIFSLHITCKLILSSFTQEMQIMTVIYYLYICFFFDKINILCGYMRSVEICNINIWPVVFDPFKYICSHLITVQHLYAHLFKYGSIWLWFGKVVRQKLNYITSFYKHLYILEGGLWACILIKGRNIVIHKENNLFTSASFSGSEGIRHTYIVVLVFELFTPFFLKFFIVFYLISLKTCTVDIRTVWYSLKVSYHTERLIYHPQSTLSHFKGKVWILTICRCISFIKSSDFLPEFSAKHYRRTWYIVNISYIIILGLIRIITSAIVPAAAVTPYNASRLL